jgi:hypothetical protein
LAPLGRVAGMCAALGMAAVLDQAPQQNPEPRMVTVGQAVQAMVLTGLGVVPPQLSLVPRVVHTQPTHRLLAPGLEARHRNEAP